MTGLPWAILIAGLLFLAIGAIGGPSMQHSINENRRWRNEGAPWIARQLVWVFAICGTFGLIVVIASLFVGAIGYGWFS